jgi:hypothetical protein
MSYDTRNSSERPTVTRPPSVPDTERAPSGSYAFHFVKSESVSATPRTSRVRDEGGAAFPGSWSRRSVPRKRLSVTSTDRGGVSKLSRSLPTRSSTAGWSWMVSVFRRGWSVIIPSADSTGLTISAASARDLNLTANARADSGSSAARAAPERSRPAISASAGLTAAAPGCRP